MKRILRRGDNCWAIDPVTEASVLVDGLGVGERDETVVTTDARTPNHNAYEVRSTYRISRRWNLETFIGDEGIGGGVLLWSYSY